MLMKRGFAFWLLFVAVCILLPIPALGGIHVFPTQLFVVSPNRSAKITLTNTSATPVEVWISFKYDYPVSFDHGTVKYSVMDSTGQTEVDASKWLRAIPQRVLVEGDAAQTVRIVGSPPAGLSATEYWGRVVISWKKTERLVAKDAPQKLINAELITETVIPIHFRQGVSSSGVEVRDLRAAVDSTNLIVEATFSRTGTAALWGTVKFELVNSAGRKSGSWSLPLVVYKRLSYKNSLDIGGLQPGQYTLNMAVDNRHPQAGANYRLPLGPVRQSITVTIR